MTAKEVSEQFGVPVSTIYWMVDTGRLPYTDARKRPYQRRQLRFNPVEVKAHLDRLAAQRAVTARAS